MFGTELVEKTQPIDPEKLAAELAELEEVTAQVREPKPLPPLVWKTPVIVEVPLPLIEGDPETARRYREPRPEWMAWSVSCPLGPPKGRGWLHPIRRVAKSLYGALWAFCRYPALMQTFAQTRSRDRSVV